MLHLGCGCTKSGQHRGVYHPRITPTDKAPASTRPELISIVSPRLAPNRTEQIPAKQHVYVSYINALTPATFFHLIDTHRRMLSCDCCLTISTRIHHTIGFYTPKQQVAHLANPSAASKPPTCCLLCSLLARAASFLSFVKQRPLPVVPIWLSPPLPPHHHFLSRRLLSPAAAPVVVDKGSNALPPSSKPNRPLCVCCCWRGAAAR